MPGNTKTIVRDAQNIAAPQYFNPTTDAYEYAQGENGGVRMNNYVRTAGGVWVPQKAADDGTTLVQLTGSKAQQKTDAVIFNAVALTNVTPVNSDAIPDFHNYNKRTLLIRNTHDVPVEVGIVNTMRGNFDRLSYGQVNQEQKVTIGANGGFSPVLITGEHLRALDHIFGYDTRIQVKATATPTVGSITVRLFMEVR